jgi:hypothetical protein
MSKLKVLGGMLLIGLMSNAQYYERTGNNFGVYFTGVQIATTVNSLKQLSANTLSAGVGVMKMPIPGITFSAGYGYSAFKRGGVRGGAVPYAAAHSVVGSVLFDKRIAKLQQKKVRGMCHYLSLGLLVGADYSYMFGTKVIPNQSHGEVGGQIGLSFCHVYAGAGKRSRSQTNHYDVFYRQGFTPSIKTDYSNQSQTFYCCEIGVRVRLMRHQVYDFLR